MSHHSDRRASARIAASFAGLFRKARNLLLAFLVLGCGSALAQSVLGGDAKFDHATTGYFLNNQHVTARCESCHIQGVFRGTPRECNTCHRNASRPNATQFPLKHIPIRARQQCDTCHKSVDWNIVMFTHQDVERGSCRTCHNGALATGKPATHIKVVASCDTCHNTLTWVGTTFNHANVAPGTCLDCHNDTLARGKRGDHFPYTPANASCDTCHVTYTWHTPYNHSGVAAGTCQTCHTPPYSAPKKTPSHIPTTASCDVCHTTATFSPANMNHAGTAGRCSTCHSGSYINQNAQMKSANHVATTQQCDACHTSTSTWATATFDHAANGVTMGSHLCSTSCHVAGRPGLPKPSNHIPTTQACDICHTGFGAFAPATMSHDGTAGKCSTCHGVATYASMGAIGKPSGTHVSTTAECDTCHRTTSAWKPVVYVHDSLAPRRCSNCHNSVIALGVNATHIPDGRQCDTCHKSYTAFNPAVMDHTGLAGRCSTCHNGSYTSQNAQAKSGSHQLTTAQCDTCHTSTVTWATAFFDHAAAGITIGSGVCATSCHTNGAAQGGLPKPSNHIPTTAACDTCHTNFSAFRPAIMSHTGTAAQCSNCHNGSYTSVGTFGAQAKTSTHITTSSQCDVCHSTTAWKPANYNHNGVTLGDHSCGTCHNGTIATGKGASHIPETRACDVCHTSMSTFLLATMNHTGLAGQCSTCHGGAYLSENAQAKSASHVPTNAQCDSSGCHASTTTWATRTVNHALLTPPVTINDHTCANCHKTGGTGLPKPTNHIPTTQACDVCHATFTAFAPATMIHTGTTGTCNTCHNGSYTAVNAQAKPQAKHIPTTASCDVCHRTTAWMPLITPYGHSGVAAGTCTTCHISSYPNIDVKPVSHIPTTASCDACHNLTSWLPLKKYGHAGIVAGTCTTCHVSSYAHMDYKQANHIPTSASCDVCHRMTAWLPLITPYSHSGIASGTCLNCHVATYANIDYKPALHIPTPRAAFCDDCHRMTQATWMPVITPYSHTGVAAGNCTTCHVSSFPSMSYYNPSTHMPTTGSCDQCHKISDSTWSRANSSANHTALHLNTAGRCADCHEYGNRWGLEGRIPKEHTSTARKAPNSCDNSGCHSTRGF